VVLLYCFSYLCAAYSSLMDKYSITSCIMENDITKYSSLLLLLLIVMQYSSCLCE
jgi:hypothetical protein